MFTNLTSLVVIALCDGKGVPSQRASETHVLLVILLIRVWAMYERRRLVLFALLFGFTCTIVPMFALGGRWYSSMVLSDAACRSRLFDIIATRLMLVFLQPS